MTSTYFGVDFRENAWRTKITINKKHKFIGYFFDEKSAAIRYDEEAAKLGWLLNFPNEENSDKALKGWMCYAQIQDKGVRLCLCEQKTQSNHRAQQYSDSLRILF